MPTLFWQPEARQDLIDIYMTIGLEKAVAAERIFTTIEDRAASLVSFPRLGVRRPDIEPALRLLVEGSHLILYETHPNTDDDPIDEIEIVRIIHGARDLKQFF